MKDAEIIAMQTADEHRRYFDLQIREKFGVQPGFSEPYLLLILFNFSIEYQASMERLKERTLRKIEMLGTKAANSVREIEDQAISEQVRLSQSMRRIFKAELTQVRQQQFGIGKYIWRSQDDDKVRDRHAFLDDNIFRWDQPPLEGYHPGMEIGCRCWAEPILDSVDNVVESYYGYILSLLTPPWDWQHFTVYFYIGFGRRVTLRQIGHLESVISVGKGSNHLYEKVEDYYKKQAKNAPVGIFVDTSSSSYDFSKVNYVHGDSRVDTEIVGKITEENGLRILSGKVYYKFKDEFTDPLDLIEALAALPGIDKEKIPKIVKYLANFRGIAYPVEDQWIEEVYWKL